MIVAATAGPDHGAHMTATAPTSRVGQQVTLFGNVKALGTGRFTLNTGRRFDWTVTTSTSTNVLKAPSRRHMRSVRPV